MLNKMLNVLVAWLIIAVVLMFFASCADDTAFKQDGDSDSDVGSTDDTSTDYEQCSNELPENCVVTLADKFLVFDCDGKITRMRIKHNNGKHKGHH